MLITFKGNDNIESKENFVVQTTSPTSTVLLLLSCRFIDIL